MRSICVDDTEPVLLIIHYAGDRSKVMTRYADTTFQYQFISLKYMRTVKRTCSSTKSHGGSEKIQQQKHTGHVRQATEYATETPLEKQEYF